MSRKRKRIVLCVLLAAALVSIELSAAARTHNVTSRGPVYFAKSGAGTGGEQDMAGEGPLGGFDAYLSAQRTYPANVIPPAIVERADATFSAIADKDAKTGDPGGGGAHWTLYGPQEDAMQPGVTSFSGATNSTASRVTTLVVSPDCGRHGGACTVWTGVSGGGVWRSDNALDPKPDWRQMTDKKLDQNSVGTLTLDPTDPNHRTLYLGTGEGNRCSSGCEAGVGIYKSTDRGNRWTKLADTCVSNAVYSCATPGKDAFLGRGINRIVIDPSNPTHIFVGSALGVRGLSHVIGNGGTTRFEPGANAPGLYESNDGGASFTEVWNGNDPNSFGVTDVGLDPLDKNTVYAAAFDQGVWRRSPALDGSASPTDFKQVFAARFPGGANSRQMFALTVKNQHTTHLPHGRHGEWQRHRVADRVRVLAYRQRKPAGSDAARIGDRRYNRAGGHRQSVPGDIPGLAAAHVEDDLEPVLRHGRLLHRPVLVRRRRLHAGGDAGHRLRDRLEPVRRAAVRHEGSRVRQRPIERTRGSCTRRPRAIRTPPRTTGRSRICRTTPRTLLRRGVRTSRTSTTAASWHRTASIRTSTRSRSTRRIRRRSSKAPTAA